MSKAIKLFCICAVVVVLNTILCVGSAKALVMESVPIWIIDGNDLGTTVDIGIMDGVSGFDFGYLDDGSFVALLAEGGPIFTVHTWNGGDVVDFAIRNITSNAIYSLGPETNGDNYCTLDFSGIINASNSANPIVTTDYWNTVNMHWGIPTSVPGLVNTSFDVAMAMRSDGDGLAPIPEPTSMVLLGMGILGLVTLRRKT